MAERVVAKKSVGAFLGTQAANHHSRVSEAVVRCLSIPFLMERTVPVLLHGDTHV